MVLEMRIALMTNNYKPMMGGVPISIDRLAKGLEALGHQVTIFAPTYREQQEEENVFRYRTCLNHFIGGIVLPNPFDSTIEEEFEKNTYDIIHVHHPMLIGRMAVYLSRKYHIPLVFTYHTRYEQYLRCYTGNIAKFDGFMVAYLHTFLKHCDFVFAPTAGMQQYLVNDCKVDSGRTGILPTGIERENYMVSEAEGEEIRRQYGAEGMPLLLTVSRMAHEKNVAFLLESLARVKELYGRPFRVLMVGDGPDKEALQKRSASLGLENTVIFTGTVPNEQIAPYFKGADGFIFASKTETQGIVVLEAFAGATPVIAVKATGVEDLVEDGVNGILTREDREEYAERLTEFLESVPVCRTMRGAGQQQATVEQEGSTGQAKVAQQQVQTALFDTMAENAYRTGNMYREEMIAFKALHYYNNIIEEKRITVEHGGQKKRNIRLLLGRI